MSARQQAWADKGLSLRGALPLLLPGDEPGPLAGSTFQAGWLPEIPTDAKGPLCSKGSLRPQATAGKVIYRIKYREGVGALTVLF